MCIYINLSLSADIGNPESYCGRFVWRKEEHLQTKSSTSQQYFVELLLLVLDMVLQFMTQILLLAVLFLIVSLFS